MRLKQFLKALSSDWLILMSSAPTVPLAVLALYVSSPLYRLLYGVLAVICAGFACFRVWREERIALESEQAKNQLPVIEAELERVYIDPLGTRCVNVFVLATLHNLNAVIPTAIKSYELSLRKEGKDYSSVQRSIANYELLLDAPQHLMADAGGLPPGSLSALADRVTDSSPLKRGIPANGWLLFFFPDLWFWPLKEDGSPLATAESVTLTVTDAFGKKHTVSKCPPWLNVGRIIFVPEIEALAEQIYSLLKAERRGLNLVYPEAAIATAVNDTPERVLKALLLLQSQGRIQRAGVDQWMLVIDEPSRRLDRYQR